MLLGSTAPLSLVTLLVLFLIFRLYLPHFLLLLRLLRLHILLRRFVATLDVALALLPLRRTLIDASVNLRAIALLTWPRALTLGTLTVLPPDRRLPLLVGLTWLDGTLPLLRLRRTNAIVIAARRSCLLPLPSALLTRRDRAF